MITPNATDRAAHGMTVVALVLCTVALCIIAWRLPQVGDAVMVEFVLGLLMTGLVIALWVVLLLRLVRKPR